MKKRERARNVWVNIGMWEGTKAKKNRGETGISRRRGRA